MEYKKEKLAVSMKISNDLFHDEKIISGYDSDDFARNLLTKQLHAYVYSKTLEDRDITFRFEKPKFMDWLLGRRGKSTLNLKVKDLLLNDSDVLKIYEIEEI